MAAPAPVEAEETEPVAIAVTEPEPDRAEDAIEAVEPEEPEQSEEPTVDEAEETEPVAIAVTEPEPDRAEDAIEAVEPEEPEQSEEPTVDAAEPEPVAVAVTGVTEPEPGEAEDAGDLVEREPSVEADAPTDSEEPPARAESDPEGEAGMHAFAIDTAAEVAVPASSMDSLTLPERSRHEADARRQRRRRSAARLPALVAPVDIPEDAYGRIDFIVARAGADRDEPAPRESTLAAAPEDPVRRLLTLGSGWVAVALLGALLIIVFLVLSLLYHR
ncbi:MAG: hypothetical protein ABR950_09950 [Candidatus Dormibacteria bacterium]